jgi:hypothetical protein
MAYASRAGRAHASLTRPRAFAVCDRCGIWYNHHKLRWQFDFAGVGLVNKRLLVCPPCLDKPQHQLRAIILPADPIPILNPRLEMYSDDESPLRLTSVGPPITDRRTGLPIPDGAVRITQDGERRVTQQTGVPAGSLNEQPGTDPNAPGEPSLPPRNDEVPETGPL